MSTKKTVHTVTAEQKEKLDKHANILARMETGKVELMKIVGFYRACRYRTRN